MELNQNIWHDIKTDPPQYPGKYDVTILDTIIINGVKKQKYHVDKAEMYFDGYGRAYRTAMLPPEWCNYEEICSQVDQNTTDNTTTIMKIIAWKEMDQPYIGGNSNVSK